MYLYKLYKEKYFWEIYKKKKNLMNIVCFKKIIINIGCGSFFNNKEIMNKIYNNLYLLSGSLPILVKCKKSISSFKIRKNNLIAIKVTLRKKLMYNFLDKLINLVIPKIKTFKGFNIKSFDKFKNFNFGVIDYNDFIEVNNNLDVNVGLNINIVFKNVNNNNNFCELLNLLNLFKFYFNKING